MCPEIVRRTARCPGYLDPHARALAPGWLAGWALDSRISQTTCASSDGHHATLLADIVVLDGLPDHVAQLLDRVLVAGQRVALGVVEQVCSVRVADVVQCQRAVQIRVQRANCASVLVSAPEVRREERQRVEAGQRLLMWHVGISIMSSRSSLSTMAWVYGSTGGQPAKKTAYLNMGAMPFSWKRRCSSSRSVAATVAPSE